MKMMMTTNTIIEPLATAAATTTTTQTISPNNYNNNKDITITTPSPWSNIYELTNIVSSSNIEINLNSLNSNNGSNNYNDNNNNIINSNFINTFKKLNATLNNSSSINNDTYNIDNMNDDYRDGDNEVFQTIEYMSTILNFYYTPIIVGTGSIGNILSVFVFFKTKLRKLSSSYYLAALAVSDTCFLLGLFAQWLNFFDIRIYNREYFCQFFTFFSNLACFCSVWFVVAFTVERFIAVMYPLRRQTMCTVRRAKMVLIGLTILGCLHCIPFWIYSTTVYSSKVEDTICDIRNEYKEYILLFNYWDTIVVFAVPFTGIVILNTFTGCTVWKFATVRRTLTMQKMKTQHLPLQGTMSSPSSSCSARESGPAITTYRVTNSSLKRQKSTTCMKPTHSNGQHTQMITHHHHTSHQQQQQQLQHQQHSHPNRATIIKHSTKSSINDYDDALPRKSRRRKVTNSSQLKVTKMLLIVSTVFVCLNLPSFIMRMITYLETQSSANEKTTVVLQYIFQLLFITNFGINFVLYCVSGQNFRKAVLSMFRKVSTTQRDGTTQITVSEYYRNSGGMGNSGAVNSMRRTMNQNRWNEVHELQHLK
ncbi:G-protein coupled receptor [Cochliomyia hominivorax]